MECVKILVACLIIYVLKFTEADEIKEFSEFLFKTSQLDQILKKGNDFEDDDDEQPSDHAWEESGKFEGDLILNDRQRRLLIEEVAEGLSRNGLKDSAKKWPNNVVIYYIQKEHFTDDQMQAIESGIEDIARASCVKFRPYRRGDRDAVVIQGSRRGCFSQVGYQGGYQVLNLSGRHPVGRGCFRHGTVVHELLHTLGFYHMQSSPDRDEYIDVVWENIIEPARHNFRKYNSFSVTDFGVGYDYDSVLHYSRRAFSANGRDTLVPKKSGASIGQRIGLSDKDTQKLNKMYCDGDSDSLNADDETISKSHQTKQNPKNKPFEGHGIGYHQGKTVVIQLPAAKTYKLSDVPSFYVFDYFSKAPQTVSSSVVEGFGVGQKINSQDYNTHVSTEEYPNQNTDVKKEPNGNTTEAAQYNNESSKHGQIEQVDDFSKSNSGNTDDDLDEAFERLGKIIKTHVYPSQVPDFSIYNPKDSSKKYEVIANQNQFTNINEIDTKNIKKKIDKTEYEKITDIDKEIYSASEETEEGKEDEDFAIKSGDSQIKNYSDPFLVGSNKPFITPKSFEHEIYDEAIDDIKNEYEIHLSNDQDYPASKYSLNDFKIPQTENFSEAFKAYKLNDNQSKPNYVLNYLDVANSKLERNQYQSRKPKSHEFKDFGLLVPLKIKFYKTDDLGDETYEHSKNTDFR